MGAVNEMLGVQMAGRRVALERLRQRHVAPLHQMAQDPAWPLEGRGLDPGSFASFLWDSMELSFVMIKRDTGEVVGFVTGTGWDRRSGTIEVTFGVTPSEWNSLWPFEGVLIFCDYLFTGLGLRKLYFALRASTWDRVGTGVSRWLTEECVYREHVRRVDGGYEDVQIWSLAGWDPDIIDRLAGRAAP